MEGTEGQVPSLAAAGGEFCAPVLPDAKGIRPTPSGSVISMKMLWNWRVSSFASAGLQSVVRRAAQRSAIALVAMTLGGCGVAEMFDPTPPVTSSRTQQSRMY